MRTIIENFDVKAAKAEFGVETLVGQIVTFERLSGNYSVLAEDEEAMTLTIRKISV